MFIQINEQRGAAKNTGKVDRQNGLIGYNIYETSYTLPSGTTEIPVVAASSSDKSVKVTVTQASSVKGTARVAFDYNGVVKTYLVNFQVEPEELHVYLCLGQSNMEGHVRARGGDLFTPDNRFLVLQAVDCPNLGRVKGEWYSATPPLVRCRTGIGPADFFGRAMAAALPDEVAVGVINVAIGGCKIELFDKDNFREYVETSADWLKSMVDEYDGNPYQRLVELARIAQEKGGIIRILLHQGESNTGIASGRVKKCMTPSSKILGCRPTRSASRAK